ncbi:hypothetical protein DFH09DRAFT_1447032, partial [Mycena vulgaris]
GALRRESRRVDADVPEHAVLRARFLPAAAAFDGWEGREEVEVAEAEAKECSERCCGSAPRRCRTSHRRRESESLSSSCAWRSALAMRSSMPSPPYPSPPAASTLLPRDLIPAPPRRPLLKPPVPLPIPLVPEPLLPRRHLRARRLCVRAVRFACVSETASGTSEPASSSSESRSGTAALLFMFFSLDIGVGGGGGGRRGGRAGGRHCRTFVVGGGVVLGKEETRKRKVECENWGFGRTSSRAATHMRTPHRRPVRRGADTAQAPSHTAETSPDWGSGMRACCRIRARFA